MATQSELPEHFLFGPFEVNAGTGELRRGGNRIRLSEQPFRILIALLARPGELVSLLKVSNEDKRSIAQLGGEVSSETEGDDACGVSVFFNCAGGEGAEALARFEAGTRCRLAGVTASGTTGALTTAGGGAGGAAGGLDTRAAVMMENTAPPIANARKSFSPFPIPV
jgi:hypothetical protein